MGASSSKCAPDWAEQILDKHSSINTHGNSAKTRTLIISSDFDNNTQHINEVLKKDPRTDKVTFHIISESDANKPDFIDQVKNRFKPTVILMSPQNQTVYTALLNNVLILKNPYPHKFGQYVLYQSLNIPIVEPVILTFSNPATTGKVGEIMKTMLKENKISNDPSTRVLWIDGSHGNRRMKQKKEKKKKNKFFGLFAKHEESQEEYDAVGGDSGLTYEDNLNSMFYEMACQDVGIQPNPSQFDSEPSGVPNVCTKGDFKNWKASASNGFSRPDISVDPVVLNPLPANSLLNDKDLKNMKILVLNIANFYNHLDLRGDSKDAVRKRREEFIKDVEKFDPTVVLIGWCYSANGDVALALRSSKIFPLMLFEHDLRELSGNKNAKLDNQQKEIVEKMSRDAVRHCVFTGASGSAKSLFAVEFTKKTAALIVREDPGVNLEIIVCCLWIGEVEEAQMYQAWKKYFQAVHGFNITYLSRFSLYKRFKVNYEEFLNYDTMEYDFAGLINAVCSECESVNKAKQDNSQTIFLFDEAAASPTDGVSDYTKLSQLDKLSSVSTVTCVNPFNFGAAGDFTVALPYSCSVPCEKGHVQQCMLSTKLNTIYRNTELLRKFLQFDQDHKGGAGLLSRKDDKLGDNLPPGLPGDRIPVTWVQCATKESMEKAAEKLIYKVKEADKEAEIVILFDEGELCRDIVSKFEGRYKVFFFDKFFGCESDVILYFTNGLLQSEPVSRGRKKLITISGPDFRPADERFLKLCAASEHSHKSVGLVKPCEWSDEWRPLVEHLVICGKCEEMMEGGGGNCSQCGVNYVEPSVLTRTKVRVTLEDCLRREEASVSKEELEALCDKEEVVTLSKQIDEACENDDNVGWKTLRQQLGELISSISPSVDRAMSRGRMKKYLTMMKISVTDEKLEDLCDNEEVNTLTQQLDEAASNQDRDKLVTLFMQLDELITSISPGVDDRSKPKTKKCAMSSTILSVISAAVGVGVGVWLCRLVSFHLPPSI